MIARPRSAAPCGVWLAVLALISLLLGSCYLALHFGALKDPARNGNLDTEWPNYRPDLPLVIAAGSSLLNSALDRRDMQDEQQYQLLAFYRPDATYSNFEAFFGNAGHVQPRVLLLHSDLFLRPAPGAVFLTVRSAIGAWVRLLFNHSPTSLPNDTACSVVPPEQARQTLQRQTAAYRLRPQDQQGLIAWIARQRAHGQAVVLIDIPRSPATEAKLGASLVQWRRGLDQLGLPVLRFPGPLEASDFCDGAHMAATGRKTYTRWLRQNIDRLLHESR